MPSALYSSSRTPEQRLAPALAPGFTAILMATAPACGDGPAAALAWDDTTLGCRLRTQFDALGAAEVHVITRPASSGPLTAHFGDAVIHVSDGLAGDMRAIAEIADAGGESVVIANADILTQGEVLAGLLADPRISNGILLTRRGASRLAAFGVQARGGHVLAVGTQFHTVVNPTQRPRHREGIRRGAHDAGGRRGTTRRRPGRAHSGLVAKHAGYAGAAMAARLVTTRPAALGSGSIARPAGRGARAGCARRGNSAREAIGGAVWRRHAPNGATRRGRIGWRRSGGGARQ